MTTQQTIEAEYTWDGESFRAQLQVHVDGQGRITRVADAEGAPTRRLARRALLPGFVNAHSHAFQRGLRGLGESYPLGQGDFWSWREAMYALVLSLDRTSMKRLCVQAFQEMLAAGFTTVGEFHYLHHSNLGADAGELREGDFAFDEVVLEAAAEAGIRISLLQSFYKTGAIGRPLAGGQRRFATLDLDRFLQQLDRLAAKLHVRTQTLGLAPHSLRAVPDEDLRRLVDEAVRRGLVCHIHVEEQRREIEECVAATGKTPLEWLLAHVPVGPHLTIVHATHSTPERLRRFVETGANVCVCPITEGNLGDGLGDVATMLTRPDAVCIGSDSNIRLDAPEELRWLEFVRRLRHERRGVCRDSAGDVARQLLLCGTSNGARALGLPVGRIEAGCWAALIAIDVYAPELRGANADTLLPAFLFGASGSAIREVCVGGRWIR
ncbi:MAG: formimidoylglutamate deiminase [Planctomycetes bacterium]|nr:formimidoylglutamate deiminase [Planctomycetota bacterium]